MKKIKGSLGEKVKSMPRIIIDSDQEFIVEVKHNGVSIAEVVCFIQELHYDMSKNESRVSLSVYNPHFKGKQTITEYY